MFTALPATQLEKRAGVILTPARGYPFFPRGLRRRARPRPVLRKWRAQHRDEVRDRARRRRVAQVRGGTGAYGIDAQLRDELAEETWDLDLHRSGPTEARLDAATGGCDACRPGRPTMR